MQLATIDQLHVLSEDLLAKMQGQPKVVKKKICIDAVYELLVLAYVYGNQRTASETPPDITQALSESGNIDSDGNIPIDANDLYTALYEPIAGETFEQRISKRIDEGTLDRGTLNRILETDWHRMEETGAYDTARTVSARTGRNAYKRWKTMMDDRVRDSHWGMEGQVVPMDQKFRSMDGNETMFPGEFGIAEEDCGCRCSVSYEFR